MKKKKTPWAQKAEDPQCLLPLGMSYCESHSSLLLSAGQLNSYKYCLLNLCGFRFLVFASSVKFYHTILSLFTPS